MYKRRADLRDASCVTAETTGDNAVFQVVCSRSSLDDVQAAYTLD